MPHPGLKRFDRNAGIIAHCTISDAEVMTADMNVFPLWQLFSFFEKFFMLPSLSIPALMASVKPGFKESDIGLIFSGEGHQRHQGFLCRSF